MTHWLMFTAGFCTGGVAVFALLNLLASKLENFFHRKD